MCGIIGYKGIKNANEVVLDGLKTLEYRGYDSFGVANKTDSKINLFRRVGKIGDTSLSDLDLPDSRIAIAHTRWATHGGVTVENAHPHLSQDSKIAVVHNGIIENFQELREFLGEKGFRLRSDTDTEVIPHLIEYYSREANFEDAVFRTMKDLEGSFAIVVMKTDEDKIITARQNSPLVIGANENEFFIASDVPAFLKYTKNVYYLDDGDVAIINDNIKFFDSNKNEIQKQLHKIDWSLEQAKKGDYKHFMLKEICEQKFTIKRAIEQDKGLIDKVIGMLNDAYGIFFVGCGTSYRACLSASYLFSEIAKKHVNVTIASEFPHYRDFLTDKTLVVAVSQSGETADVLEAVKAAKRKGSKILALVNVMGSTLTRLADEVIMINSGPEICVLATKSYTSQLAILMLLAYSIADRSEEGRTLIEEACGYVDKVIDNNIQDIEELANQLKNNRDFFLIGRDLAYPSAMEGALKIKEVSYIHAEGFPGGELKHGPIALIEEGTPVIVLTTEKTKKSIISNAMEVKARGAYLIGIDDQPNDIYDHFIYVPFVGNAGVLLDIIPIQLLAYYLALALERDPDKPRNLAKSVTVK